MCRRRPVSGLNVRAPWGKDARAGTLLAAAGGAAPRQAALASLASFGVERVQNRAGGPAFPWRSAGDELLRPGAAPAPRKDLSTAKQSGPCVFCSARRVFASAGGGRALPGFRRDTEARFRPPFGGFAMSLIVCGGMSVGERDLGKVRFGVPGRPTGSSWEGGPEAGQAPVLRDQGGPPFWSSGLPGQPGPRRSRASWPIVLPSLRAWRAAQPARTLRVGPGPIPLKGHSG